MDDWQAELHIQLEPCTGMPPRNSGKGQAGIVAMLGRTALLGMQISTWTSNRDTIKITGEG